MSTERRYVTFGYSHYHEIGGQVFDKDCIALVHGDMSDVYKLFGRIWCFEYTAEEFAKLDILKYFPRGIIEVK